MRIDRGPTGSIGSGGSGEGLLALEGLESGADGIYRFWYSTLRVAADGSSFEGEFAGSERIGNPCGSEPPVVTCFVTAGHLLARRIRLATPVATSGGSPAPTPGTVPPGAPTDTATPSTSPAPSATAPTPSAPAPTSSPPGTTTPTATAGTAGPSPTPGPTRLPLGRALLPDCRRR